MTAQSINWLLAAGSYFLLPSLGPVYLEPSVFARPADHGVSQLQDLLLDQRVEFLRDPAAGAAQSIGAFSSLHVSFFFTAALHGASARTRRGRCGSRRGSCSA